MMDKQKKIFEVMMSMLPKDGHQLIYDDVLYMNDNMDETFTPGDLHYDMKPVKLMFVLVVFCTEGKVKLRLNMKEYDLTRNTLMVVPPGTILDAMESHNGRTGMMAINKEHGWKTPPTGVAVQLRTQILNEPQLIPFSEKGMKRFVDIFMQIRTMMIDDDMHFKEEALMGYTHVLSAYWMNEQEENQRQAPSVKRTRSEDIFYRFIDDVKQNYKQHRNVAFYADKACLTPKYLGQVITRVSGRHPIDWIRDYVILDAKAMIISGEYTIQQISTALGFPNASFFGKYFKESVGCSPGQYGMNSK